MPDNVCQCFFFSEADAPEMSFSLEQDSESPTIQVCDSQNVNLLPAIEVSCVEESRNISTRNTMSSSEELNIPEFSPHCLDKLSPDRNSADRRSLASPRSGEHSKTSSNTEIGNISSGYALSLDDHSSNRMNFTSPSSGEDSKRSSNKETSPSSGYAMSLGEQSFDRNFTDPRNITTSPSSGDNSKNGTDIEKGNNGARDLDKIDTDSQCRNKTGYRSSQSSPSEQGHRNIKQLRTGESSKSKSMLKHASNTDSKHKFKNECRSSQSSPSEQGQRSTKQLRAKGFSNSEFMGTDAYKRTSQNARGIHTGSAIRFENRNIRHASYRPLLPRPFPPAYPQPHQPYMNPAVNMPVPTPYPVPYPQQYPQPFHSYGNAATNIPLIRANVPERFPVAPRPQASTSYQHPNSGGSGSLSKKSLAEAGKMDLQGNIIVKERVENWISGVSPDCLPPEEPITQWSAAENEENEAIAPVPEGPGFPETSPDERSSTEISEEENRRQRSLRRPPRNNKKGRPK